MAYIYDLIFVCDTYTSNKFDTYCTLVKLELGGKRSFTLVPCDFDISPLPSDQKHRYRQSKVGSLLVSPRLFVRQICYDRLKRIALTRQQS